MSTARTCQKESYTRFLQALEACLEIASGSHSTHYTWSRLEVLSSPVKPETKMACYCKHEIRKIKEVGKLGTTPELTQGWTPEDVVSKGYAFQVGSVLAPENLVLQCVPVALALIHLWFIARTYVVGNVSRQKGVSGRRFSAPISRLSHCSEVCRSWSEHGTQASSSWVLEALMSVLLFFSGQNRTNQTPCSLVSGLTWSNQDPLPPKYHADPRWVPDHFKTNFEDENPIITSEYCEWKTCAPVWSIVPNEYCDWSKLKKIPERAKA